MKRSVGLFLVASLLMIATACPSGSEPASDGGSGGGSGGGGGGSPCYPLGAACADAAKGCYVIEGVTTLADAVICAPLGTIPSGGSCTKELGEPPECVANNLCRSSLGSLRCTPYCNLDGGLPGCGTSCQPVFTGVYDIGTCY